MKAILMLEDGRSFIGSALGSNGERVGEVVFNTAVVGYQEMITDPANAGKILVLTYPLIGNYGCAPKFNASDNVWTSGLVIKEKSRIYSNWQAKESLDAFVRTNNLLTLCGIDTRTLAVHMRQKGEMLGIISTECFEPKALVAKIKESSKNNRQSVLPKVSVAKAINVIKAKGAKIAILDLGITRGIIKQLAAMGLSATLFPFNTSGAEILRATPDGLIISNGPEDDAALPDVASNIKGLIGRLPMLGISTGHQVIGRALGVKTLKMKLGHRGVNYPMYTPVSYKAEITAQNHSWVLDAETLSKTKTLKISGYNLNDRSVEEIESKKLKFIGAQYLPVCPGFDEVNNVFKRFAKML